MASRSSRVGTRRKLNPAFAAAHGISLDERSPFDTSLPPSSDEANRTTKSSSNHGEPTNPHTGSRRVEHALKSARASGKLNLSNSNLTCPLPDEVFDLRSGIQIDVSFDATPEVNAWDCHGEETLTLVDFSDNDLSSDAHQGGSLDDRVGRYRSVQILRAKRCNLTSVPLDVVGSLEVLTVLDLSGNKINSLPFRCLPESLKELDLSSNELTSLVDDGRSDVHDGDIVLPNLTQLELTNNRLTELPSQLKMDKLRAFHFGENHVSSVPESLIRHASRSLNTLEAPKNNLSTAPDLYHCEALKVVDFCDNNLTIAPRVNLSLVRLALSNNSITSLDEMFPSLRQRDGTGDPCTSELVELRLRSNQLKTLSEVVMASLIRVTLLDLGENDLRDVPYVIGYLPSLRRMPLDGNPLRVIRPSLAEDTASLKKSLRRRGPPPAGGGYLPGEDGAVGDSKVKKSQKRDEARSAVGDSLVGSHTLDLGKKQLSELPHDILTELSVKSASGDFCEESQTLGSQVKTLNISRNLLRSLGVEWPLALPNLNSLDGSFNQLENLPNNLGKLPLTTLLLNRNCLNSSALATSALCSFSQSPGENNLAHKLSHLDLSSNEIDTLPDGIFDLPTLSSLILSHNKITTLARRGIESGWRPGLPSLENLDLSNNRISDLGELPIALGGCGHLRSLLLNNNELKAIPPSLGLLESLQVIDLRGNPQRGIRLAILDRNCDGILTYLQTRMDPKELEQGKDQQRQVASQMSKSSKSYGSSESAPTVPDQGGGRATTGAKSSGPTSTQALTSPLAEELRTEIDTLSAQLNNVHLTEAKKYAMKKKLALQKSKLIREERRLKTEGMK